MRFVDILAAAAHEYGIGLSQSQLNSFDKYNTLLLDWNEKINLTAITDPREVAVKHMVDSLSCYDDTVFLQDCKVVDVGTGAGFPGLPLKIIRPDIKLTLLDSLNKRLNFLRDVADNLSINDINFVHARAEEAGQDSNHREQYQVALSRAVARLNVLAELCLPFVKVGGFFVALKGAQYKDEVDEASKAINLLGGKIINVKIVKLPGIEDQRAIIYIKKDAPSPKNFPRRPGIPEKKPIE